MNWLFFIGVLTCVDDACIGNVQVEAKSMDSVILADVGVLAISNDLFCMHALTRMCEAPGR